MAALGPRASDRAVGPPPPPPPPPVAVVGPSDGCTPHSSDLHCWSQLTSCRWHDASLGPEMCGTCRGGGPFLTVAQHAWPSPPCPCTTTCMLACTTTQGAAPSCSPHSAVRSAAVPLAGEASHGRRETCCPACGMGRWSNTTLQLPGCWACAAPRQTCLPPPRPRRRSSLAGAKLPPPPPPRPP